MLTSLPKSADAYDKIYDGSLLLLKVSGAEIASAEYPRLLSDIAHLTAKGIRIILVFGGQTQIDKAWGQTHAKPRPKVEGIGITNADVLMDGVLPAYRKMYEDLMERLPTGSTVIRPENLLCRRRQDAGGFVGVPEHVELPEGDIPVTAVGFVGMDKGGMLNVNADDIARVLVQQYNDRINEVVMLTGSGGIYDKQGTIVPLMTEQSLARAIAGEHPNIELNGGMLKKAKEIQGMLPIVGKVAVTKTDGLLTEIHNWRGSGTLGVYSPQCAAGRMTADEAPIFDEVFGQYVERGIFRPRSAQQLHELRQRHRLLRAKNSPLGGYSLVPHPRGWLELSALWSSTIGNGIGQMLLQQARKDAARQPVYALAKDPIAIGTFERAQFVNRGPLKALQHTSALDELSQLNEYDTEERDVRLLTSI